MGGPNNLREVEVFLRNMFADPNILTTKSKMLRAFIGSVIVSNRAGAAAEVYFQLGGKSPIVAHTKNLVKKLQDATRRECIVKYAMRYTPPFAKEIAQELEDEDIKDIYLIPLYPQYSTTTTKSSLENFIEAYEQTGGNARLHTLKNFYRNETYNQLILKLIIEALGDKNPQEFELIFSAHGLPQKIVKAGDPYERQINRHVTILKEKLIHKGIHFAHVHLAYQSKVGPMKWLEPSLEAKLKEIRTKKVIIFPIAFTIDNSETDYELGVEYAEIAKGLGITDYLVAKCPNDDPLFVQTLLELQKEMRL